MSDWQKVRLGDVLTLEYGKALPERSRDGLGSPVLGSNGVVGRHSLPLVTGPGIVVGRKGTAGSVTWVEDDFFPIDTTYFVRLQSAAVTLEFVRLLLEEANLPSICAQTGVPGLNRDRAYEVPVSIPSLDEQRRIVEVMSSVERLIHATEMEASTAASARRCLVEAASQESQTMRLGEVSAVSQGKSLPKDRQGARSGDVSWFKIADMTSEGNQFGYTEAETQMAAAEIEALNGVIVPAGAVVFPRVGAAVLTEKKRILDVPAAVDENHLVLSPRDPETAEYLLAALENLRLGDYVQTGAVPSLNMGLVRSIEIPWPADQGHALALLLEQMRHAARARHAELEALRAVQGALLAAMLAQEISLPEAISDEPEWVA